ncbi:hypothetical protein H6F42_20470 [Pseudanabaena sp. FACHB-1998]|nr:hypothetical protein [Pseudanabaena sp. FACHB-1998]
MTINLLYFSLISAPVTLFLSCLIHQHFYKTKSDWYYRDHWLSHHIEFDFVYLHGNHHDTIPSGLIGVAGNGFLEGFLRHTLGHPTTFLNPVAAFFIHNRTVKSDINNHQYIPGVYPFVTTLETTHHSVHHYGNLAPYGLGLILTEKIHFTNCPEKEKSRIRKLPKAYTEALKLDESISGYCRNNTKFKQYKELVLKFEPKSAESNRPVG